MRDAGEPLSLGQLDRRAAEARGYRVAWTWAALITGAVLINGILAILFFALMQALGMWTPVAAEAAAITPDVGNELRSSLEALVHAEPSGE